MANIFDSNKYTAFMYVAILVVSLLILFNFVNVFENKRITNNKFGEDKIVQKYRITGFTTHDNNDTNEKGDGDGKDDDKELYSEKSYFVYYIILIVLGFGIIGLAFRYFLPAIKKWS